MTFKRMLLAGALALSLAGCARRHFQCEPPREADLGPLAGGVVGQTLARGPTAPGPSTGAVAECQASGRCSAAPGRSWGFDECASRYYYHEERSGRDFWEDGRPRY
jgi:hypothetical protein